MSDRFLAVVLALCLALPLCLSLDDDLFESRDIAGDKAALRLPPLSQNESLTEEKAPSPEVEAAARRFSELAVEALEREAEGLESAITWRPYPPKPQSAPPTDR